MSTRNFPKVFVFGNAATELVTDNTKKPIDLTSGQIGFFNVDRNEIIGVGTGATPTAAANPLIQIHQNIGDNRFGTVRTKTINVNQVKRYYKSNPSNPTTQITHLGNDGTNAALDLTVPVIDAGKAYAEVFIHIQLFSKKLRRWYGDTLFKKTLAVRITSADTRDTFAAKIIAQLNGTDRRPFDIAGGNELAAHITGTKVTMGTSGQPDYRVGVKLETVAVPEDAIPTAQDPTYEREVVSFAVSVQYEHTVTEVSITETQAASGGTGWAAELASREMESQGFDRVRETFGDLRFMKQNPFIVRAVFGTKYDALWLEYDWTHNTPGGHPQTITEPYIVCIAAATSTLQATANVLNSWLNGKFAAVTL